MKKRKLKDNKNLKKINRTNNNISPKIIIIVAIIILIIVLFFIAVKFTGNVVGQITGPITGYATSTVLYNCTDSDNGVDSYTKGICEDRKQKYEDKCYNKNGMWEYYCGRDKYACIMQETACPFGCEDGRCLRKGENVSSQSSVVNVDNTSENNVDATNSGDTQGTSEKEIDKNSYLSTLLIILVVIILIFVILFLFRKKSIRFRKSSIKLKWK